MEVTETSKVTADNYKELKTMLLANDEASKTLALTIVEQSDFENSKIFILCLLKDCFRTAFGTVSKFKEVSPDLCDKVTEALKGTGDVEISKLSFKEVYDLALSIGNQHEIDFMLGIFRDELVDLFEHMDFKFMSFTDLLVKPKGWEEAQAKKIVELEAQVEKLKEERLYE